MGSKRIASFFAAAAFSAVILASAAAGAQWVTIGRKAMGKIESMRGEHADVATVLLEAPAEKVYAAALEALGSKKGVKLTAHDDATMTLDFSAKRTTVKMKVGRVDEKVSMLTVTSPGTVMRSGDVSAVVDGVLRVCGQMKVECREGSN